MHTLFERFSTFHAREFNNNSYVYVTTIIMNSILLVVNNVHKYICDECHKAHSILLHSCCATWVFIIELCAKVQISIGNYPIKLTG